MNKKFALRSINLSVYLSPPDPFYNIPYEYGVFFLWVSIWWADILDSEATVDLSGMVMSNIFDKKYHLLLQSLQKTTLDRSDILVYQTKTMEKPLTFAGPISAVLYASTSAKDIDWLMRLVWVTEGRRIYTLAEGKIRARFCESMKKPKLLTPGKIYKYALDLWQAGVTIPEGDSLRVEISSASFPLFSRNLNTGGHSEKDTNYKKAKQKIYYNQNNPSHVLLSVIPDERMK